VQRTSAREWDRHIRTVDDAWQRIEQTLARLELDYRTVRVYQDGLPVCGHETRIVADLAASGSRNHQILRELLARGATLVGTESPTLLVQEYERAQQSLARLATDAADARARRHRQRGTVLLEKRDRFIAQRVDATLGVGEVGLIFLGLLHRLKACLPRDIRVTRTAWWTAAAG
jgi:hypothetical protein